MPHLVVCAEARAWAHVTSTQPNTHRSKEKENENHRTENKKYHPKNHHQPTSNINRRMEAHNSQLNPLWTKKKSSNNFVWCICEGWLKPEVYTKPTQKI